MGAIIVFARTAGSWGHWGPTSNQYIDPGDIAAFKVNARHTTDDLIQGLSTLTDNSHFGMVQDGVYFTSGGAITWWNEGSVGSGGPYMAGYEIKFETYLDVANGNAWSGRWVSVDGSTVLKDYGA